MGFLLSGLEGPAESHAAVMVRSRGAETAHCSSLPVFPPAMGSVGGLLSIDHKVSLGTGLIVQTHFPINTSKEESYWRELCPPLCSQKVGVSGPGTGNI